MQPVAEPAEAVTVPDEPPAVSGQHDVDPAPPEPGLLVESVTGAAGKLRLRAHLQYTTLRRSSAERQLELRRLVEGEPSESTNTDRHLQIEPPSPRRGGHDDERPLCAAHFAPQRAAIDAVEPSAAPPPAGQRQNACDRSDCPPRARGEADRHHGRERNERRQANEIREPDSHAEGSEQRMRRRTEGRRNHGATRSLSWSSRAGPIPGTASSASTDVKAPCFWR